MDFYRICSKPIEKGPHRGEFEVFVDFRVGRSKDIMVQGRSFYAIWDEEVGLWSRDEYDVQRLVDADLDRFVSESKIGSPNDYHIKYLGSFNSRTWSQFRAFLNNISDSSHPLDNHLTFANTEVKKSDHVSRRLPYPLEEGSTEAWDELVGTLYSVEERSKIEWAIGAVVSGDSKKIQKFLVFYGPAGTGKSTILNIIGKLFEGYTTSFEAKALGSNNNAFATEAFRNNPLVAIQHDGDLSNIQDNTKLNSIISHEEMTMNEKFKPSYTSRVNAFLFMGTNQPVKISDAKSGIIRRLIDVHPTGVKLSSNHYTTLMNQIDFELGAIAYKCLHIYQDMGKNYYNGYRPLEMMLQTDVFFNFIEANYDVFKSQDGTTLKQAYILYKEYCSDTGIEKPLPQYKIREELRNYFEDFHDRAEVEGQMMRSVYSGFTAHPFKAPAKDDLAFSLVLDETQSLLDEMLKDMPAQYATDNETPSKKWANVTTTLEDIDTSKTHYVKLPDKHIVIDFDLRGEDGAKSLEQNLQAASSWPATYGELSRSGDGVHLHYLWEGDTALLAREYSTGIEIKVYSGDSSLRRKFTRGNAVPVATISSGLPLKEKKMLTANTIQSEKGLRDLIARNLRKEIHPGTKPSIDFIHKILEDAYESGMAFDVTDLRPKILAFANNSTNQPMLALKMVQRMKFQGKDDAIEQQPEPIIKDDRLVFFDVEVYPNLFGVCWKYEGDADMVKMINPSPNEIEELLKFKLVGFNNRRYDNHILYARYMGYSNDDLYKLSQKIISGGNGSLFGEAYNISYADIYDYSSKKQTLKKFGIEMGMDHIEMDIPWDEPVPVEKIEQVMEYCANDVLLTEATHNSRRQDFIARQMLAELSGLTVNDTTQKHTAKIVFAGDRNPQASFVYTDLSKEFNGYVFDRGRSLYRDIDPGEGGYVYAEPGLYEDVALLDVASMHPTSIRELNLFGEYTKNFNDLVDARLAIKRRDYEGARVLLGGKLAPFLDGSDDSAEGLSWALKIVINIVYGLTSAKFDNPFRDKRNIDNIVAKRGALFMIDLQYYVQEQGFTVAHIKTDSIKIPNATPEIIEKVKIFGEKYGYTFEHEATYDKLLLVNDAVYVAGKEGKWTAVGAQFQHPYVFKKLFSHEPITFNDMCETKQVTQGAMYLDFDAVTKPAFYYEGRQFIGRIGRFVPVTDESGGGLLVRVKDDKDFAVSGTKGYLWMEAHVFEQLEKDDKREVKIDETYFEGLVDDAVKTINKFGSLEDLFD
jgi:energy-coupling factor transporter ATP-binding protein EcfA2